ncbi:MAG: NHL repeat-containing protein [Gemmatimonadota bacterium]|nr:NHL repeat-containing protein [Gemmatimonadota bacterium]
MLPFLFAMGCSETSNEGMWRGRIEVEKGVRRIHNDWPIMHHPDSLMQVRFVQDIVIEGRVNAPDRVFPNPYGVTTGPQGEIYIADAMNSRILKYDENGTFIVSVGSKGHGPLQFQEPVDMAVDKEGRLYVLDFQIQRVTVFTPELGLHDIFQVPVRQPRRIRIDAEGNILIFVITQHDLIYKYAPNGNFIESFYDPLESLRIMGSIDQLLAYSDAGMVTTDDGYVFVSSRHPYRIRKYDRVSGLALEFNRTTPFDLSIMDIRQAANEGLASVGQSGALAVLPDGRVVNMLQYQEYTLEGVNSLGAPQLKLSKLDRWVDVFTAEGRWQMTSKITLPGFPVHTDRQGKVYFSVLDPPRVIRYTLEFPEGVNQ